MPLDPRIPLGVQPAPLPNPLETISTIAQIQGIREQSEARRIAAEKARQTAADEAAIRRALQATGGDIEKALPVLRTINPKAALEFETEIANRTKAGFEGLVKKHELATAQFDTGLKILGGVDNDTKFQVALPLMRTLSPQVADLLGDTYDPSKIQQLVAAGQTLKEREETKLSGLKLYLGDDPVKGLGMYLSTAENDQAWNGILTSAKRAGAPQAMLDLFGSYSPENVTRAGQITITPEKREELAGQQAARQETAAQHAATQAQQAAQLEVSRGHLTVSQAAERRQAAEAGKGGVKLSPAQQEDISTMLTVQDLGTEALTLGDKTSWRGTGPVQGRVGPIGARWFGAGGEEAERLRNLIGNIQGTVAKLRGGTAFSAQEQILLERYTPTIQDGPLQIKTKLKSLNDFIVAKRENVLRVAGGEYTPRERPPAETPDPLGIR